MAFYPAHNRTANARETTGNYGAVQVGFKNAAEELLNCYHRTWLGLHKV